MGMQDDILQMLQQGPPQAPPDLRLLGWQLNQPEMLEYERKRRIYDTMASTLIPQMLNPLRDATLGQVSNLSGMPMEQLATPDQMRTQQVTEPSMVPRFNFRQDPSNLTLTPPGMGIRPGIEGPEKERYLSTLTPGELDDRWSLPSYQPFRATLGPMEGPPEPGMAPQMRPTRPNMFPLEINARAGKVLPGGTNIPLDFGKVPTQPDVRPPMGEFEPGRGPDVSYGRSEIDPNAPSNLVQQMVGSAALERTKKWPSRGMGGSSWQQRYATIEHAFGTDAADYWAAEGFLPEWAGGVKAPTYTARAEGSQAGAELKNAQTDLTRKKVGAFDENTDLERKNKRSMIEARNQRARMTQAESTALQRLRNAQAELAEMRAQANVPAREIEAKEASVQVMERRLKTLQEYLIMADKYNKFSKDAETIASEELAGDIGLSGEGVREPGFMESLGQGLGITPKGTIERRTPDQAVTPKTAAPQAPDAKQLEDAVNKEIESELRDRGVDSETARKGPVKYKGKVYRFKGGRWAE